MTATAERLVRCGECGEMWADEAHLLRCADRRATREQLLAAATTLDQPVEPRHLLDLWAFLSKDGDYRQGAKAALVVMQLGWRHAVGT